MNNEYKKGFLEAIDKVLSRLKESQAEFVNDDEFNLIYYTKLIENKILSLKIQLFEKDWEEEQELHSRKREKYPEEDETEEEE